MKTAKLCMLFTFYLSMSVHIHEYIYYTSLNQHFYKTKRKHRQHFIYLFEVVSKLSVGDILDTKRPLQVTLSDLTSV